MKRIVAGALATIATLGLLSACGSDAKESATDDSAAGSGITLPAGITLPDGITIPDISIPDVSLPDVSLPIDVSNVSVPQQVIDQMIAQFEAAGMKVDKACFTALLSDESLRKLVEAGGTPNQDAIKKFFTCLST
jgi:ABC-type glycerol-3-phosphate transport system substrate-binding protein